MYTVHSISQWMAHSEHSYKIVIHNKVTNNGKTIQNIAEKKYKTDIRNVVLLHDLARGILFGGKKNDKCNN